MNPIAQALPGPLALDARALAALAELADGEHALANAFEWHRALEGKASGQLASAVDTQVVDGVAVIRLEGMLVQRRNWLTDLLGATAIGEAHAAVADALAAPDVRSLLLAIDSPGGTVFGIQELAALIRESQKPIAVHSAGSLASAAYWLASGAHVIAVSPVAAVGSIGVVATHVDVSGAEAARGIKTTEVTAGRYKRVASSYAPLSEAGRASLQEQVDVVYSLFVEDVAAGRSAPPHLVLDRMADGRVFIGRQAVSAGLVDTIASFDQVLADLQRNPR